MSSRVSRDTFIEDREYLSPGGRPRPRSEAGYYDRREERREEFRSPSRGGRMREVDQVDVRVRERSRERERDRDPFARYHEDRRVENGAMVLRQREVETVERERPRARAASPSAVRIVRRRSPSRSPSPPEREMSRIEIRDRVPDRERDRYRAPEDERVVTRIVQRERERERTPSSSPETRDRIRIVSRAPSPSPSPPPPPPAPPVIRGPVVEREVITHYTDVDHGVVYAPHAAPPPPQSEPARRRDMDIDVFTSRNETRVDISEKKPRERRSSRPPPQSQRGSRGELVVQADRRLDIEYDDRRNRSHSAAPPRTSRYSDVVDDEADYIASRIDERGRVGEARHGATQDWSIVDVPPGTERVRMDGAGGGAAEVTWQRYNGVRRTRFIPDRQDDATPGRRDRDRDRDRDRERDRSNINVQIVDNGRHRDREIDIQQIDDDRVMVRAPQRDDMWTEITKDLVNREAIERLNYKYTETDYFFYILQYLHHDDVQELVKLTEHIRRNRRHNRPYSRDEIDIDVRQRKRSRSRPRRHHDDVREQEIIVDRQPARTYYR